MIQKKSVQFKYPSLLKFTDMLEIRLIVINNVDIFTIYESVLNFIKILLTVYQKKSKVSEKNEQVPGLIIRKGKFC